MTRQEREEFFKILQAHAQTIEVKITPKKPIERIALAAFKPPEGQPAPSLFEKILSGAPPMAPLLFPNLVVLGLIALWALSSHVEKHEHVIDRADRDRR